MTSSSDEEIHHELPKIRWVPCRTNPQAWEIDEPPKVRRVA
jgi:hypothetical protein